MKNTTSGLLHIRYSTKCLAEITKKNANPEKIEELGGGNAGTGAFMNVLRFILFYAHLQV